MTCLAWLVAFKFRLAQVLPPADQMTAPMLRLMMTMDDVRRAQISPIESGERLDGVGIDKEIRFADSDVTPLQMTLTYIGREHDAQRA